MVRRRDDPKRPPATHLWPPALFSCRRRHTLPHGLPLLPPPAVSRSRHTLTGRAAHGSPPRRPQTPAGGPPLAAAYLFLLPEPRPSARPRLLRSPPSARNRHALTGSVAHGTPPKRPQTPAGDPPLAARPFLLPSPSHPSARPPAFATARRLPEPSHLNGARGPWFAAATTPNARRRPTFGRPPFSPAVAVTPFRAPPRSCCSPPFPLAGTARPFGQPRGRQIFHAGAGFCPYMQGFARACGILLI